MRLQGDIVAILDSAGSIVVQYKYDAWGRPISKTGTLASTLGTVQPFRYRGYVYDEETGLYYLRSRYYNPQIVRFVNADEIIEPHPNQYCYCKNAPIGAEDPDGYSLNEFFFDGQATNRSFLYGGALAKSVQYYQGNTSEISSTYRVTVNAHAYENAWTNSCYNVGYQSPNHNNTKEKIPQKAYDTLEHLVNHGYSPMTGYKGGRTFQNDGRDGSANLPSDYMPFREFDIDPKLAGRPRNAERIVVGIGNGGAAWYTPDHYRTFFLMREGLN